MAAHQAPPSLGFSRRTLHGVDCHFLLQCMKVKSEREVTQSCPTLSNPMGCRLPGSSVHRTFQARVLGWGATAFSIHRLTQPYPRIFVQNGKPGVWPRSLTPTTPALFHQHVHGLAMFIFVIKLTEGTPVLQNTKALKETAKHQVNIAMTEGQLNVKL